MFHIAMFRFLHLSTHDLTRRSTGNELWLYLGCDSFNSRPHKEVDHIRFNYKRSPITSFNSRPHKEVDDVFPVFLDCLNLSTHDLTRRSTFTSIRIYGILRNFQLTTSQGGRPSMSFVLPSVSIFQLTTSQGGRPARVYRITNYVYLSTHDLTRRSTRQLPFHTGMQDLSTHDLTRRSTGNELWLYLGCDSFNSRPHKEVDSHAPWRRF